MTSVWIVAFSIFVLITIILTVIVELLGWFYVPTDGFFVEFRSADGVGAILEPNFVLYAVVITTRFILLVGLLTFQKGSRFAFLIFSVVVALTSVLWGYRVTAPIEGPFNYLERLMDGVVLALAYYSSASSRFRNRELKTATAASSNALSFNITAVRNSR